jgi:hypothetical protein
MADRAARLSATTFSLLPQDRMSLQNVAYEALRCLSSELRSSPYLATALPDGPPPQQTSTSASAYACDRAAELSVAVRRCAKDGDKYSSMLTAKCHVPGRGVAIVDTEIPWIDYELAPGLFNDRYLRGAMALMANMLRKPC